MSTLFTPKQFRDMAKTSGLLHMSTLDAMLSQAADDRDLLLQLMTTFDGETWECLRCGHSEAARTMDSALSLRAYLTRTPKDQTK